MISKERLMKTIEELVSAGSISGTCKENLAVDKLVELISEIPYFKSNSQNLQVHPIPQDPFERSFVSAIYRSNELSKDTFIITGHFDVVDVEEFGHLKDIAFDITSITNKVHELNLNDEVKKDLDSGEWIFGRGVADMKNGLAIGIEILREFSKDSSFNGNILFLAVPGEESNSEGMLASVPYLEKLQEEGFCFKGCIVAENIVPKWSGDHTKRVYMGTIGKVMPLFFCRGKEAHVCDGLSSLNPNLVISEVTKIIENNPYFCTPYMGECNTPPVCLKQTDLKDLYNVQTPLYAAGYYNLLSVKLDGKELMEKLKRSGEEAFAAALSTLSRRIDEYSKLTNTKPKKAEFSPKVITFKELWSEVESYVEDLHSKMEKKVALWQKENFDNQTIAIKIMKELCDLQKDKAPLLVIGFAPPFYPAKLIEGTTTDEIAFMSVIDQTISFANQTFGEKIEKAYFYDGICDLSYTGLNNQDESESVFSNMSGVGMNYGLPVESLKKLNIPGIVFGGLGKDFHKNTERLHVPYSIEVVPHLYEYMILKLFENSN